MRYNFLFLLLFPIITVGQSIFVETEELFEQKEFGKAEQKLQYYLGNYPNDVKAIELLGDAFGYQKKWENAIVQYKQLVQTNSSNADYHYKYGGSLGMKVLSINKFKALGLIGDIKNAFLKAAELDPNHINTRWALVEFYMQLPGIIGGSKKKSLKYANELEQISKVDGYLAKGYINEYDNEPELAEKFYKLAIQEGGSLTCFQKLTALYENQNEPQKAISNIENAQKKHERNALHYQIGKVAAEYNVELQKGEQCLHKYIKNHSPEDGVPIEWAYYRLAQIYKHQNNKTQSLNWINKALTIRTDFKQALKEKQLLLNL